MIHDLKSDELIRRTGGAFRLTALLQRRLQELVDGARPLVETKGKTMIEIVVEEVAQGKVVIDYEASEGIDPPDKLSDTEILPEMDAAERVGNEA
ncbi:MAG: DNA-directed RNA polymerase subunit omega [Sedimentisphaerales bacterium]|nr:DNA-directed RNA polymerase subunit omega [Sedimentisphaerales bacterium]